MSTEWFLKYAGSDIAKSQADPGMLLINIGKPDWVTVPPETGYGGRVRCLEIRVGCCPVSGHDHLCLHYVLDGSVWCAECVLNGQFLWYKRP